MTINYKLAEFESPQILLGGTSVVVLDWVSHGNYAIHTGDDYLNLERHHFSEILDAFTRAPKPSKRKPFWTGVVPCRGLDLNEHLIEVYAISDTHLKLITSTCSGPFALDVPHYHCQMNLAVEAFRKMAAFVANKK